jgi:threonine dehydratase
VGSNVLLKCENQQITGSFKVRGAFVKIASLTETERQKGVVAASAGNHAQGVAFGAAEAEVSATVVMPKMAPITKVERTRRLGADVILHGSSYDEAEAMAKTLAHETGRTFIHAFDDPLVVLGQGTVGLEILTASDSDVDCIVVPVGGGGLVAGIALAAKAIRPHVRVVGVQAEGAAACYHSFKSGSRVTLSSLNTVADGLAVRTPGILTFDIIQRCVDDIVTVTDGDIVEAVAFLLESEKLLVEGAGAAGVAAVRAGSATIRGRTIAVVLSGGNMDVDQQLSEIRLRFRRIEV